VIGRKSGQAPIGVNGGLIFVRLRRWRSRRKTSPLPQIIEIDTLEVLRATASRTIGAVILPQVSTSDPEASRLHTRLVNTPEMSGGATLRGSFACVP
jgi:hypothetical protein